METPFQRAKRLAEEYRRADAVATAEADHLEQLLVEVMSKLAVGVVVGQEKLREVERAQKTTFAAGQALIAATDAFVQAADMLSDEENARIFEGMREDPLWVQPSNGASA